MMTDLALAQRVRDLRQSYKDALSAKVAQAKVELEPLREDIEILLVEEYNRTNNIAHLCRLYGTGDRRTIYDILEKHGVR